MLPFRTETFNLIGTRSSRRGQALDHDETARVYCGARRLCRGTGLSRSEFHGFSGEHARETTDGSDHAAGDLACGVDVGIWTHRDARRRPGARTARAGAGKLFF